MLVENNMHLNWPNRNSASSYEEMIHSWRPPKHPLSSAGKEHELMLFDDAILGSVADL